MFVCQFLVKIFHSKEAMGYALDGNWTVPTPLLCLFSTVSAASTVSSTFYHHLQERIGFNTANSSLSTGKDFPMHSLGTDWWWIWTYSTKTRELLGNPPHLPLRFPSTLKMSLGLRPCDISRVSGNLFGFGDGFPDTSIVLMEHGYSPQSLVQDRLQSMLHCLGNTLKTLL